MKFNEIVREINNFEIVRREIWEKGEILFKMSDVVISEEEILKISQEIGVKHKGFEYLTSLDSPINIQDCLIKLEDNTLVLGWVPLNEDMDAEDWIVIE